MRIIPFLILTIFAFGSCTLDSKEYNRKASSLIDKGEFKLAINVLNEAISIDTENRRSYFLRGYSKMQVKEYRKAISDFEQVLKIDPRNALALANIANCYENLNEFDSAVIYYNKCLESEKGLTLSAITLNSEFDNDDDTDYYVDRKEILFERGTAYFHNQDFENAISDFKTTLLHESLRAQAHNWLFYSYLELNDTIRACSHLQKGIENGLVEVDLETLEICN